MAADSASKKADDISLFETLITDALERLTDKVATMIDPINAQLQEINNKLETIAEETRKAKEIAQFNTKAIAGLKQATSKQQEEISKHQDKIIQIETHLRENRLKLRGVAEDLCPPNNLSQILLDWFATLLQRETNSTKLIENAYRVGKQRQKEPRDVIVQLNNTTIREKILSLAKKRKTLNLQNSNILVFPDIPAEAVQRRRSLKETTATLRSMDQRSVLHELDSFQEGELIIGGDLNVIVNPALDRSYDSSKQNKKKKANSKPSPLADLLEQYNLIDVWRQLHRGERDYTH
ncbi:UNVERIFIED_CONTAM: hypothetical protein K2H54_000742 [Gekko kuhli]